MKFTVDSAILLQALTVAKKAIERQPKVVILENFLFVIEEKRLSITGSDLTNIVTVTIPVTCPAGTKFDAVVPVEIFKYLSKLTGDVTLTWDQGNFSLEISEQDGRAKYSGDNAGDFPKTSECSHQLFRHNTNMFTEFKNLVTYTSRDELRPVMCGVNFVFEKGELYMCATDGHRLKMVHVPELANPDGWKKLLFVGNKTCEILSGFKFKESQEVVCSVNNEMNRYKFSFMWSGMLIEVYGWNVDERAPNYFAILPKESFTRYTIDRKKFLSTLDKALLFAHSTTHQIRLSLLKNNKMSAENLDFSKEFCADMGGTLTGAPIEIGFNGELLKELIESVPGDVTLELGAPNRAAVVKSGESTLLLMPIMLHQFAK